MTALFLIAQYYVSSINTVQTLTVNDLVQRYLIHMLQNTNDLNTQIYSDSLISKNSTNSAADAFAHCNP